MLQSSYKIFNNNLVYVIKIWIYYILVLNTVVAVSLVVGSCLAVVCQI